jgi:hypothetical protein
MVLPIQNWSSLKIAGILHQLKNPRLSSVLFEVGLMKQQGKFNMPANKAYLTGGIRTAK